MKTIKLTVTALTLAICILCSVPAARGHSQDPAPKQEEHKEVPKQENPADTETEERVLALGFKVFDDNCSGCHDGGENLIVEEKSLKKQALEENGFKGPEDIEKIVLSGRSIMPSFKESLSEEEIKALAAYVWAQSQKDWK